MCRYAWHNYRDHFACFRCRKAFKYGQWEDRAEDSRSARARLRHIPRKIVCPDCSRPMIDMGLDFKAPPNRDREVWEILEVLNQNGFTFHSCGCHVGFKPPRTLREVPAWLEEHRGFNNGELLLIRFSARGR
jgi:hypothetical protein